MNKFVKPHDVKIGDLVWYFRGGSNVLFGPLIIVDSRRTGYGGNGRKIWIMFDSERAEYHQAEKMWLRVPRDWRKE